MQYKNKKQIEEEIMKDWSYGKIKDNNGYSLLTDDTDYNNPISPQNIFDRLHQIRQDDLNAIKGMIKEEIDVFKKLFLLTQGENHVSIADKLEQMEHILQKLDNLNKE